jgi:Zn-dependent protease
MTHPDPSRPSTDASATGVSRQPGVFGGGSWPLGRVAGIRVAVDHSWVLIFLLITLSLGMQLRVALEGWNVLVTWSAAVVASLLFFASILLHELGHSVVAQRLGVRVKSITLFVFGGLAQLESEARRPRDEFLIALTGPLVSVTLGVAFRLSASVLSGLGGAGEVAAEVASWLGRINLILAAFNLVPGFPLDGGRALRGIVWAVTGSFERATTAAALAGSVFAYFLIGLGIFVAVVGRQLFGGLWLAFIGWFLLSAARATVGGMVFERILEGVSAAEVMESVRDACVSGSESVTELVGDAVLRRGLRTFYLVDREGRLRGLVTLRELARVPADERGQRRVGDVAVPLERLEVLAPDDDGWVALRRMAERRVNQLPVLDDGRLLGAVTRERLIALVQAQLTFGAKT